MQFCNRAHMSNVGPRFIQELLIWMQIYLRHEVKLPTIKHTWEGTIVTYLILSTQDVLKWNGLQQLKGIFHPLCFPIFIMYPQRSFSFTTSLLPRARLVCG